MRQATLSISTADDCHLVGTLRLPEGVAVSRAVVIAPALGVPQTFYADFAAWLTQQGLATLCFDWRGIGASAPQRLSGFRADLLDWAQRDAPAIMQALAQAVPDCPITWLGHSMGGILVGAMDMHARVDQVVTVAAGHGHRRFLAKPLRYYVGLLWHVAMPLSVARHGYFAGQRFRAVGDLPKGVAMQWRRWCLLPDFVVGHSPALRRAYAEFALPLTVVMMTDDRMATNDGVRQHHRNYLRAPQTQVRVSPHAHGFKHIGHFDLFRRSHARLWPLALSWVKGEQAKPVAKTAAITAPPEPTP